MTLSNIRFSNSGNIVADHKYNEVQPGGDGRKVNSVKVIAKPDVNGDFKFTSSSEQGRKLAVEFAKENGITIQA